MGWSAYLTTFVVVGTWRMIIMVVVTNVLPMGKTAGNSCATEVALEQHQQVAQEVCANGRTCTRARHNLASGAGFAQIHTSNLALNRHKPQVALEQHQQVAQEAGLLVRVGLTPGPSSKMAITSVE